MTASLDHRRGRARREYFGPDGPAEMRGHHPKLVQFSVAAHNEAAAARLWAVSEELTGVTFEALTTK